MPHARYLLLPLAAAALLTSGSAHAEARRSAQSLPVITHFSAPPAAAVRSSSSHASRDEDSRGSAVNLRASNRSELFKGTAGERARYDSPHFDSRHFDSRRYDDGRGRGGYEEAKEHEGHHFHHGDHDHDDSPGC